MEIDNLPKTGLKAVIIIKAGLTGSPVAKNLPSNAEDADSIPSWGTEIPYAVGQLSLCTATRKLA